VLFPTIFEGFVMKEYIEEFEYRDALFVVTEKCINQNGKPRYYITDDFKDIEKTIAKIEDWKKKNDAEFSGIIGIDDDEKFISAIKIAEHFHLNFLSRETGIISSNKFIMKEQFVKNNVPSGKFALVRDGNEKEIDNIPFPNVLKILSGNGTEFVFLNKNMEELMNNVKCIKRNLDNFIKDKIDYSIWFDKIEFEGRTVDPKQEFLVEEYLNGDEYSCDFVLYKNKIKIIRIAKKYKSPYFGYILAYQLLNKSSIKYYKLKVNELKKICGNIAKALMISNYKCPCMVDFMVVNGEIKIIETSARPGMGSFVPMMRKIYSYTSISVLYNLVAKKGFNFKIPKEEGLVVNIFAEKEGKINKFNIGDFSDYKNKFQLINKTLYFKEGDSVKKGGTDYWGLEVGRLSIEIMRKGIGFVSFNFLRKNYVKNILDLIKEKTILEIEK